MDNKKESFLCIEGSLPVKELKFVCGEFIFMNKKVIGKKFLMLLKTRQVLVEEKLQLTSVLKHCGKF